MFARKAFMTPREELSYFLGHIGLSIVIWGEGCAVKIGVFYQNNLKTCKFSLFSTSSSLLTQNKSNFYFSTQTPPTPLKGMSL